jgi:hypothetical protein
MSNSCQQESRDSVLEVYRERKRKRKESYCKKLHHGRRSSLRVMFYCVIISNTSTCRQIPNGPKNLTLIMID